MLQGLHAAAAGMSANQSRLDAVSNDIANVNTTGYKQNRVAFRDLLYVRDGVEDVQVGSGAGATTVGRGYAQGALQVTDRPLDVAIAGPGFLRVQTPDGPALTRAGDLQVDAQGRLATRDGALVPGVRPLPVGADATVKIGEDGTVRTANGQELGRLQIVNVPSPDGLRALGNSRFAETAESGAAVAANPPETKVLQGNLEASNVDMSTAMVDLIESQRAFAMSSRAVQSQDQMWEIANGVKR